MTPAERATRPSSEYRLTQFGLPQGDLRTARLAVNSSARVNGLLTLPYIYNFSNVLTGLAPGASMDIAIETVTGSAFYLATTYNSFNSPNTKLRVWVWAEALNSGGSNNQNKYWVRVENLGTETCTDYDWVQVIKFGGY